MPQTVLLIHDDCAKAKMVQDALLSSLDGFFIVDWVERCADGLLLLRKKEGERIAAILLSLYLPDSEGVETFDRIFKASPNIPILVLSSPAHENAAKLAVQLGAQDYVLDDDLDGYLLPKALRNMLERAARAAALFSEKERAQVTRNSCAGGRVCPGAVSALSFLNPGAEAMPGWLAGEASARPFAQIFR